MRVTVISPDGSIFDGEAESLQVPAYDGQVGILPDLRRSAPGLIDALEVIVLQGALEPRGMPSFAGDLSAADVESLKQYLRAVHIE